MAKEIPLGTRGEAVETVEFKHTLTAHHRQLPPVYSTPDMIRLMETAAFQALQPYCEADEITVGTSIHVEHRAASGIGAHIQAEAVLEAFDGRFYTVRVTARDHLQEIGRGTVGRAVVRVGKFLEKNAWDVASARIVQETGFPAIATTSAGIAFAQGFPDGQKIPAERMIAAIAQIAAAVAVPVTADVEAGYGQRPEDASRTARKVIEAGAVGMNFEDATGNPDDPLTELNLQVERIRAIRETAGKLGVPLVVNARTDVYLAKVGEPNRRYDETLRRLAAYGDAGADCLFVPGVGDRETIGRMVRDLEYPINILAVPGAPSIPELVALGVKRISLGSGPMRASLGFLRRLAQELKTAGTYKLMEGAPSHAEMNQLMGADRGAETPEFGTEKQAPGIKN